MADMSAGITTTRCRWQIAHIFMGLQKQPAAIASRINKTTRHDGSHFCPGGCTDPFCLSGWKYRLFSLHRHKLRKIIHLVKFPLALAKRIL